MPKGLRSKLGLDPNREKFKVNLRGTLNFTTFARAITKIAYCQAVAQFGLTGFRRLVLPDIILGRYRYISYFVGADIEDPPPPHPDYLHRIAFHIFAVGLLKLMIISVRLFANLGNEEHGFPIYRVVTGAPADSASMASMKAIGREQVSLADV
jgi:hypothetical protein